MEKNLSDMLLNVGYPMHSLIGVFEPKMPDELEMKLYAVSFFKLTSEGLIKSAREYGTDKYEPPEGRRELAHRYS